MRVVSNNKTFAYDLAVFYNVTNITKGTTLRTLFRKTVIYDVAHNKAVLCFFHNFNQRLLHASYLQQIVA